MAKDPAFLFYSGDFLTGCSDLTFEERGQYITLMCLQHQKGNLSEKIIKISVPNVTPDVLAKFTKDETGHYYNKRLEKEVEKRREHTEKQRQRALDGWKKRKATADATALPLENENENENENINKDEIKKKKTPKPKTPKKEIIIPEYSEFEKYALENQKNTDLHKLELKYKSWIENKWHTGKGVLIKNWKTTLLNTLQYLQNEQNKINFGNLPRQQEQGNGDKKIYSTEWPEN